MKKWNGFSIIELLIIISIVSALTIIAAPSFFSIFKQQFLLYKTNQAIQDIRNAQSNAFTENKYYKVGFNSDENTITIWKFNNDEWVLMESTIFESGTFIEYENNLSNQNHIMYGPNGNAFLCYSNEIPTTCSNIPLNSTSKVAIKTEKKEFIIEFLTKNGYVSSNVSVK